MVQRCEFGHDGAAHRVADGDHGRQLECPAQRGGIVCDVFELVALERTKASAVTTMIESDERAHLGELLVSGDELEIDRGGPTVEEEHGRRVRIGVDVPTDEHLAAPLEANDRALGKLGREE